MRIPARLRDLFLGATGGIFLAGMLGLVPGDAAATADRSAEVIETGGFAFTFERTVPGSPRDIRRAHRGHQRLVGSHVFRQPTPAVHRAATGWWVLRNVQRGR